MTIDELKEILQRQANILVASGTGKVAFDSADAEYRKLDAAARSSLKPLGLKTPFPWRSLWEWHGFYSQGELPTYASRRMHIAGLVNSTAEQLDDVNSRTTVHDPKSDGSEPTWDAIDSRISGLIQEYSSASEKDTWQDVGRRSREILIDLGKLVASADRIPEGQEVPKAADARAWIDNYLDAHAMGSEHAEFRAVVRKTWDLAQKVTHGDIDDIDAFAAAQATVMIVRTVQKLASNVGARSDHE